MRRAHDRLRAAPDADPGRQRRRGPRIDRRRPQRGTQLPFPGDLLVSEERGEQVELLLEELLVLIERQPEEREGFREGAPSEDHLRSSVRHGIERREPLEDADRVVRAEHGHRGSEPDALRPRCRRSEDHLRRGDREVGPMMLADAEECDAEFIGQRRLVDDLANDLRLRRQVARPGARHIPERVEAELNDGRRHPDFSRPPPSGKVGSDTKLGSARRSSNVRPGRLAERSFPISVPKLRDAREYACDPVMEQRR